MSEAYFVTLLLAGGVCLGFALHALMLARHSREHVYVYLILLALFEAAYCIVAYGYFRELRPSIALRWARAICCFTPFITYLFGALVGDVVADGQAPPRWFRLYQRVNLVLTIGFAVQVALDGIFGMGIVLSGVVETDLASHHRHRVLFAAPGEAWLAWVTLSFVLFAVILFRACGIRRQLLPMAVGCAAYFAATIWDFGILTDFYDAYFVQHLGFFVLVIGCWWVLAGRYEISLRGLQNAIGNLELERRKLLGGASLVHRHKLDGMGALAAGVAHEINNPVQGIMNFASLLKRQTADPTARTFATEILGECNRVTVIVRALLSFSRADEGQLGGVGVRDLVEDVVRLVRGTLTEQGASFSIDLADDVPEVNEGAQRLKQVIMNLLTNACDALRVRDPERQEPKFVHIAGGSEQRGSDVWLIIDVIDNADGIESGLLDRIFEPFFTTKPPGRGTGLGLAISQEIVAARNGRLSCTSTRGAGTCFRVELPMKDARRPRAAEERQRTAPLPRTADLSSD
jgi:signal transduction histidine kinase